MAVKLSSKGNVNVNKNTAPTRIGSFTAKGSTKPTTFRKPK